MLLTATAVAATVAGPIAEKVGSLLGLGGVAVRPKSCPAVLSAGADERLPDRGAVALG
jgi:hypothetical protein